MAAAPAIVLASEHRFPLIPGKDFAGTAAAVGARVEDFAVGDPVLGVDTKPYLGAGTLAQYVAVPADFGVGRAPEGLAVEDAGALPLAGTAALDSVNAIAVEKGETVLVSGATGGVGALAVQLLAARGARIVATARPGAAGDFVLGLTDAEVHLVDYTDGLDTQVRALAPDGVDAALHLAGDGRQLVGLLRPGGRIASPMGFGPDEVRGKNVTVTAVRSNVSAQTLAQLAAEVVSGAIRVPVTGRYSLEQLQQAFTDFAGALGKLAVTVA